jgi:protein-tyrosine phosphatase
MKIGGLLNQIENKIERGVKDATTAVTHEASEVAPAAKTAWTAATNGAARVKDGFIDGAAQAVGVAELAGLRYPVSSYEFKVSDTFTRGSRIDDPQGYDKLKAQGFKGIVDLTLEGTNDAKGGKAAGLNTLNVKILDNSAPTQKQMKDFLDFATNPKNSPCYVHCEAGKGRTGVASACYRMAVEGWPPEKAIAEGKKYGCTLPDQVDFLQKFGADLAKGKIAGYPL